MAAPPGTLDPKKVPLYAQVQSVCVQSYLHSCVYAFTRLGVPDLLTPPTTSDDDPAARAQSIGELAAATKSHEALLYRLLRTVATAGYLKELPDRRFALTQLGAVLREDDPGQSKYILLSMFAPGGHLMGRAFLTQSVQHGTNGFKEWRHALLEQAKGPQPDGFWPYLGLPNNKVENSDFNRYMTANNIAAGSAIAKAYDFGQHDKVVDVGGGEGLLISTILRTYPSITKGHVIDLPSVIDDIRPIPSELAGRLKYASGDFFKPLPEELAGTGAFVLKHILHDWSDEESVAILQNLINSLKPGSGRIVLAEAVVPTLEEREKMKDTPFEVMIDIVMMSLCSGRERTLLEWQEVLGAAGLEVEYVTDTHTPFRLQVIVAKAK